MIDLVVKGMGRRGRGVARFEGVQGAMPRDADFKQTLCADIDGFSLHAAVRCGAAPTIEG